VDVGAVLRKSAHDNKRLHTSELKL
jgi:hypothetical protein